MTVVGIIEDNAATAVVLAECMRRHGFAVRVARTVAEAKAMERPDIAIVDNELPDGTGAAVIAALDGVPCIPMTGSGEWVGPLPPVPLLRKPFSMAELVALVAARLAEGG